VLYKNLLFTLFIILLGSKGVVGIIQSLFVSYIDDFFPEPSSTSDAVVSIEEIDQTEVENEIEVVTDTDTVHKPKSPKKLTRTDLYVHKGEIFICSYCGKRFGRLSSCVRHEKICQGNTIYLNY
jgi:hypothetical protein